MSLHGSSCCHNLQKGILPFSHSFSSSKPSVGLVVAQVLCKSLIYECFLHQQQGVAIGMVTDFLYFIAITNSSEAFKKEKKYPHPINIFRAEFITATCEAHIRSLFSSHTTISP